MHKKITKLYFLTVYQSWDFAIIVQWRISWKQSEQ